MANRRSQIGRLYHEYVSATRRYLLASLTFSVWLVAQSYSSPAGLRPALRRNGGASILPGGRIIAPLGDQYVTGSGPFGLAVGQSGNTLVTANGGPGRNSLTILERGDLSARGRRENRWQVQQIVMRNATDSDNSEDSDWRGVFMGLAFANEHTVYVSEGNSGRVSLYDWNSARRRVIDINRNGVEDSYTGDLALDAEHNVLYVVDQANFRVAVIDTRTRQVAASVRVGRLPFALALSPDRRKLYVANIGMFEYQAIPGADPKDPRHTGLAFPAFGFPSPDAATGVGRPTERGPVNVPGLGDPNVKEANSVCVVDVSTPTAPKVETFIPTGLPFSETSQAGSSPSGIVTTPDRIFVSNANDDSVTVINARTNQVEAEIPIRIPGLETLRGVLPIGMAYHERTGWLLVAEAGINAVAVIDPHRKAVLGHLPVAWFPTRVALSGDTVFVTNGRGQGRGPNALTGGEDPRTYLPGQRHEGSVSIFPLPQANDLAAQTAFVMQANGFNPHPEPPHPLPAAIKHVVLIVKENRTYDEVFGDLLTASNGPAMSSPELARLGTRGYVNGRRKRLSLKDLTVTPNHHAIARQWAFADNFYADSDVSVDGHHWLAGAPPNAWTETSLMAAYSDQKKDFRLAGAPGRLLFAGSDSSVHPEEQLEGGVLWHHLARHGITFRNFGEGFELAGVDEGKGLEPTGARFLTNVPMPDPLFRNTSRDYPGFNMNVPDQFRASQFIHEIEERYVKPGGDLPQFLFIHLPNDHMADERPEDGYPYRESFVADNDYALGRILEYLASTKWWSELTVFITEDDAQGGVDHIDAQRTVLLAAGPWVKKNYVTHTNTSFPGLLKTIFRLLGMPPLNLFDASTADLADLFANRPNVAPYHKLPVDPRLFNPSTAKESHSGVPGPRMDR